MKPRHTPWPGRTTAAFTMTETLVAMGVFMLAVAGVLSIHLFGLKMNHIVEGKLRAGADARRTLSLMMNEIRAAGTVTVGTVSGGNFTAVAAGAPSQGNALRIHPVKTNQTVFVQYYLDTDGRLKRKSGNDGTVTVIASAITNKVVFTAENFDGQMLTNQVNNRVIGLTLQFCQLESPFVPIGPGCMFDFYQLRTRVTRRALE